VPEGLTLSQRLTRPDGLPTAVARGAAVALVLAAAAFGYAAGPDGHEQPAPKADGGRAVAISRLAGELPIVTPEPRPGLRAAAALPALHGRAPRRRTRAAAPVAAPRPQPTPIPSATPEPTATPRPVVQAPPPTASARPAPAPRSTPASTFDLSG
jgi:hypothetical protein